MSLPITADALEIRRGSRTVLSGFSLTIAPGERVAVTGPSGVGKSSLLMAIAGLIRPRAGALAIGGAPVSGPHPAVTMMQQRPALLPWATVAENVALGLRFSGAARRDPAAARATVAELLETIGLADRAGAVPAELSGGQQQRVALARALAPAPDVLLLDEPFSALDPETRAALRAEVLALTEARDVTVLLVTHDAADARALCRRSVALAAPRPIRALPAASVGRAA